MERPAEPSTANAFRRRAVAEAARYGADALVFVRELLQNARDAGARRVDFTTATIGGVERLSCRDDGDGMTFEEARRFLFALYASSKDALRDQAGKFGIGFWSVLRFEPSRIRVRSRAAGQREGGWQVDLDGRLETVATSQVTLEPGTEVVLERTDTGALLADDVLAAAHRHGRFLSCRDDPDEPLVVTVDGRRINAELSLPAPSVTFRGKGFRGAVGFGEEPRVELFAHGLFVRSASHLHDLRADAEVADQATAEDVLDQLPSQAPVVLLDSQHLDLLLARSDVRQDRHLERMLRRAEKELDRLIRRQLHALRPQPWYRVWAAELGRRLARWVRAPVAIGAAVGAVLAAAVVLVLPGERPAAAPEPASAAIASAAMSSARMSSATLPTPSLSPETLAAIEREAARLAAEIEPLELAPLADLPAAPALIPETPASLPRSSAPPLVAAAAAPPAVDGSPAWLSWTAAIALVAGGFTAWRWGRRRRASFTLDGGAELAGLLAGALRHPAAFAGLPAIFYGRYVPLLGSAGALSLDRARRLADQGRLFRSHKGSELARRAVARGVPVVDSTTPEGEVVGLALGAVDLDHWSGLVDRARESGLTERVDRILAALDEPWRLRLAGDLSEPLVEIDLRSLRLGPRWVLVDPSRPELAAALDAAAERPDTAAFLALDALVERLDLAPHDQARILAAFGAPALAEAAA